MHCWDNATISASSMCINSAVIEWLPCCRILTTTPEQVHQAPPANQAASQAQCQLDHRSAYSSFPVPLVLVEHLCQLLAKPLANTLTPALHSFQVPLQRLLSPVTKATQQALQLANSMTGRQTSLQVLL